MWPLKGKYPSLLIVLAGKLFNVAIEGTHAHSFITSFTSLRDIREGSLTSASGRKVDFLALCISCREEMAEKCDGAYRNTNESELAAFIDYAQAYPKCFFALIDTYDVLYSGLLNFIVVALALYRIGFKPLGVRLDSGDLAYLSTQVREGFRRVEQYIQEFPFADLTIMASNDINESVLHSLNHQGHEIDCYGIGTHLVTCQAQPALGCVYKLVEIEQQPRIKLSAEQGKTTLPGKKVPCRLYDKAGMAVLDILTGGVEALPQRGQQVLCRHPFEAMKRVYVTPDRVEELHKLVWDGERVAQNESVDQARERLKTDFASFREDHQRNLNPTPYKVSVSDTLYSFVHRLMESEAPIKEIE